MKRIRISKRGSRRLFTKTAKKVKSINVKASVARGGIRM